MHQLAAFLGISALVIVTPGQDTALTIRNTLRGGRRGGAATALGVAIGQLAWTLAASAGVVALLRSVAPAFAVIRLAGAAYLVFLGALALRDGARRQAPPGLPQTREGTPRIAPRVAFRQGVISNLGNPKMALFFSSLLPQFAPREQTSFASLFGLGLVFCSLTLGWLTLYALVVARAGDLLRRHAIRRTLDLLVGTALVGSGLRLAMERR